MATSTDNRLTVAGRPLKPVAMGLTLTMVIVTQANLRGVDRGTDAPLSYLVAGLSVAATLALIAGWFTGNGRLMRIGLLLVVAVYTARAVFIAMASGSDQAVWFSLATVIIAGGSYLLESRDDTRGSREG